ncbi:MAG: hypothetical protein AAF800_10815 [Planctomycetota bacterium]
MENLPREEREHETLFTLIEDVCQKPQIKDVLRRAKDSGDKQARVSGNLPELVSHLRDAYTRNTVTLDQLRRLLGRAEENGNQYIYYYRLREESRSNLSFARAGERAFGDGWEDKQQFPDLKLRPGSLDISDFREETSADGESDGWTLKFARSRRTRINSERSEKVDGQQITVTIETTYEDRRVVLVVRWRARLNILEVRVSNKATEARKEITDCREDVWSWLERIVRRREFTDFDLRPAMKKIFNQAGKTGCDWDCADTLALDEKTKSTARFSPSQDGGNVKDSEAHQKSAKNYSGIAALDVIFRVDSGDDTKESLRAEIGVHEPNEVRFGANATARAIDFAAFRFHEHA